MGKGILGITAVPEYIYIYRYTHNSFGDRSRQSKCGKYSSGVGEKRGEKKTKVTLIRFTFLSYTRNASETNGGVSSGGTGGPLSLSCLVRLSCPIPF